MASTSLDRTSRAIVLGVLVGIVQLAAFSLIGLMSSRTFPIFGSSLPVSSTVFRGEFIGLRESGNTAPQFFSAVDPQTGRSRDLDLPFLQPSYGLTTDGDHLWSVARDAVIETDGTKTTRHRTDRSLNAPASSLFLYQGRPAVLDLDENGVKYRLLVFVDGQWQDRGEVALPGLGRTWVTDETTGRARLEVRTSLPAAAGPGNPWVQFVIPLSVGGDVQLFLFDHKNQVVAFRVGLDVVSTEGDAASAMAPENVPADTTGWIKLDWKPGLMASAALGDRAVVAQQASPSEPIRFWEQTSAGSDKPFRMTTELKTNHWESLNLIQFPNDDAICFLRDRPLRTQFLRYKDGDLFAPDFEWESDFTRLLNWGTRVAGRVFAVLLAGTLVLAIGAGWISRSQESAYQFGARITRLAPIWKRGVARGIDLLLIFAPLGLTLAWSGLNRLAGDVYDVSYDERSIRDTSTFLTAWPTGIAAIATWIVLCVTQARWGWTPGKWLYGLRVTRSTLRPCGFARSLLRELVFAVDVPLLLTAIPGVMSLLLSERRQRLGDLTAETVVVEVKDNATEPTTSDGVIR